METLMGWILMLMVTKEPLRNHYPEPMEETKKRYEDVARNIVKSMVKEEPFKGLTRAESALIVLAVINAESRFVKAAENPAGNNGNYCLGQINVVRNTKTPDGWTGPELAKDREKCITATWHAIKVAWRFCGTAPHQKLAKYQGNCDSPTANKGSAYRMFLFEKFKSAQKIPMTDDQINLLSEPDQYAPDPHYD